MLDGVESIFGGENKIDEVGLRLRALKIRGSLWVVDRRTGCSCELSSWRVTRGLFMANFGEQYILLEGSY